MATVNLEFTTAQGVPVLVEVEDKRGGPQRVSRDGVILQAGRKLEDALEAARPTVEAVLKALEGVAADEREVEFGLKLTTEAGAVVAKTAVEGHFVLRLVWRRDTPAAG
jgi:hypothetical protein